MSEYLTQAETAGEKYLTTLAKAQDDFVVGLEKVVAQLPKTPEMPAVPAVPGVNVPTAGEITTAVFDFAEKVLSEQRTQADKLVSSLAKAQETVTEAIASFIKQLPNSDKLPAVPAVDLPTAGEITAASFNFAEKLVAQQRTQTEKLVTATTV